MRTTFRLFTALTLLTLTLFADARQKPTEKYRVLISTDIGGTDPDDNQSLAHLMMYSDEFELEGLVSSPSFGSGSAKEIYRMIDVYEQDYPTLKSHVDVMAPDALRKLVKQGRTNELPPCGYAESTEGSEWIVKQARKDDPRPLYVLVWGCLEDVAQALHDAPDIAKKIRVYWIGGPNKKWGVNGYCYIIEHFPDLWMIENNTTYRAFIYDPKNQDKYNMGFFETFIKDAGNLGRDFAAYYKGNPKLGDTPSLLYMMDGDPSKPEEQSWGGKFVRCNRTPRTVFHRATTAKDTVQICGIIEWQLEGPKRNDIAIDSACITLDIRNQKWKGYYKGNDLYVLRHSTYYTGTLDYTITSTIEGFEPITGQITVENTWNRQNDTDYLVGSQWWTDSYTPEVYWHNCAGARYQFIPREEIMEDWGQRWNWLKAEPTSQIQKPWDHGEVQVSDNQRFLQHADGTPYFWLGETAWLMPQRLKRDEVSYYLNKIRDAGYNMTQMQVLNDVPSINFYEQLSSTADWKILTDKENYGYWEHMDYVIDQAELRGIYIGMVCIWGGLVKAGKLSVEQAKTYGTFLANRYKDRPNIIWIIGGDIQGDIKAEIWETLATTIKSIDKNHLMTYHPRGRYTSAKWWSKASWIDFHTFQSGHRKYGQRMGDKSYPIPDNTEEDNWMYVDSTWAYKPIKPVFDDEPIYEGIPKGLHDENEGLWQACDVRRYAYWSVFAGSCGHTYGHNAIMQFYKPGYSPAYFNKKVWTEALEDPGFNQMKYLKRLILSFPYFERVPDQSTILENGTQYERLIATRGNDYLLVYNYTSREMKIDLRKISGNKKKVWWMNASTGQLTYLGEYDNNVLIFRPQKTGTDIEDGVLIAFDSSKDYLK